MAKLFSNDVQEKSQKREYLTFRMGQPVAVQFLDDEAQMEVVHTVKQGTMPVKIVHEDLPIWNTELGKKAPVSKTFRINVLDVTPVKVCPSCKVEYSMLANPPQMCYTDMTDLSKVTPTPRNKVMILEKGIMFAKALNRVINEHTARNSDFDYTKVVFMIVQVPGERENVPDYKIFVREDIPISADNFERHDLSMPKYTEEEIGLILRGTSLKSIFEARKRAREESKSESPSVSNDSDSVGIDYESSGFDLGID